MPMARRGIVIVSKPSTNVIVLGKDESDKLTVSFPYNPELIEKVKSVQGYRWNKEKKQWIFPDTDGTLEKILKAFEGEAVQLAPELQKRISTSPVIARSEATKQSQYVTCHASRVTSYDFKDLWRELLSRKYSYQTVKAYLFYNKEFLNFIKTNPHDITDSDIQGLPSSPCRR